MRPALLAAILAAACGGSGDQPPNADTTGTDSVTPVVSEFAMPEAPAATRGRLAVRSAGPVGLDGDWSVRAGWCAVPPMLQVLLEVPNNGLILLLALPATGSRVATYPVTTVSEGIPEGPASQAGVQRIIEGRPYAWQAEDGQVELYAWDDDRVSGRFALTMRNIATSERSMMAGSFLGVQALELGLDQCQPSAPAAAR